MKTKILALLAVGALTGPLAVEASVVTVWDTFDGTPISSGMAVGTPGPVNIRQGIAFQPSASGYFYSFTFGGNMAGGTADWLFTLRANQSGLPGAVLETLPLLDVTATAGSPGVYTVAANGTSLLTAGATYWLMAEMAAGSSGTWSSIETGTGTRAFCDLITGCASYTTLVDSFVGAAEIRVVTAVPEPATLALLGLGLAGLGLSRRRKGN